MAKVNPTANDRTQPFVKWAGGKRQLIPAISERLPECWDSYYEPFIGGGAILMHFNPERATINDINSELIHAYRAIRDNPLELMEAIDGLDAGLIGAKDPKEQFYTARSQYNELLGAKTLNLDTAALFIFLNKHCFNGLYRVNAKGLFNVPYNGSTTLSYSRENILAISEYLKSVTILNGDFEVAVEGAKEGDFVFFDSPYAPLNPTSFESYTKEGFAESEHRRLAALFESLTERGCYCMLTNHSTELIHELYSDYKMDEIRVKRAINSDASKRTGVEVIVRNY